MRKADFTMSNFLLAPHRCLTKQWHWKKASQRSCRAWSTLTTPGEDVYIFPFRDRANEGGEIEKKKEEEVLIFRSMPKHAPHQISPIVFPCSAIFPFKKRTVAFLCSCRAWFFLPTPGEDVYIFPLRDKKNEGGEIEKKKEEEIPVFFLTPKHAPHQI